jgi:hypothetical protein
MAKVSTETDMASKDVLESPPRSLKIAQRGIKTSEHFCNFMSALMSDLIEGKVTAQVGNASCNAGGKLLKMVDMTYKYGNSNKSGESNPRKTLTIAFENSPEEPEEKQD